MTNRNPVTTIPYSIYHINNDLHPEVWNDIYACGAEDETLVEARSDVINRATRALQDLGFGKWAIARCVEELSDDFTSTWENDEPIYEGETDGIKWRTSWLGGAPHLIVLESPYYGVGDMCSPCVPNALNGSTVTHIFTDATAAEAHRFYKHEGPQHSQMGYALPTTWLRDKED